MFSAISENSLTALQSIVMSTRYDSRDTNDYEHSASFECMGTFSCFWELVSGVLISCLSLLMDSGISLGFCVACSSSTFVRCHRP